MIRIGHYWTFGFCVFKSGEFLRKNHPHNYNRFTPDIPLEKHLEGWEIGQLLGGN